jgi:hypothetical protein
MRSIVARRRALVSKPCSSASRIVGTMSEQATIAKQLALLRFDHDTTVKLVENLNSVTMTARGFFITITVALLTVAEKEESWLIAALALGVIAIFFTIDVYYSAMLGRAYAHLLEIDAIFARHYASLASGDTAAVAVDLARYEFGLKDSVRKFTVRDFIELPLRFALVLSYLVMLGAAICFLVSIVVK